MSAAAAAAAGEGDDSKQCIGPQCSKPGHKGCSSRQRYCAGCCPKPETCALSSHNKRSKKHSADGAASGEAALKKPRQTSARAASSSSSKAAAAAAAAAAGGDDEESFSEPAPAELKLEYLKASDLKDIKTHDLRAKCLGRFLKVPTMDEGNPAGLEKGAFVAADRSFHFLVREKMLQYIKLFREVKESEDKAKVGDRSMQPSTGPGRILGGAFGVGKSTTIHTIVHVCRQLGFLVLYIPNASELMDGSSPVNQKAWSILNCHLNSHRPELNKLKQKMARDAKYGTTLEELLMVGWRDCGKANGEALDVLATYFQELAHVQDIPVLIAVDRWHAVHAPGKLMDPVTGKVNEASPPGDNPILSLIRDFNSFSKLTYGCVLFGVSSSFDDDGLFIDDNASYRESVHALEQTELAKLLRFFVDKQLLPAEICGKLNIPRAVPLIHRETGGLPREVIRLCRNYGVSKLDQVPWSLDASGVPSATMIKMYHMNRSQSTRRD